MTLELKTTTRIVLISKIKILSGKEQVFRVAMYPTQDDHSMHLQLTIQRISMGADMLETNASPWRQWIFSSDFCIMKAWIIQLNPSVCGLYIRYKHELLTVSLPLFKSRYLHLKLLTQAFRVCLLTTAHLSLWTLNYFRVTNVFTDFPNYYS